MSSEKDPKELSLEDMEKVTGGFRGKIFGEKVWLECEYANTSDCPGRIPCVRFGTSDCVDGKYFDYPYAVFYY